MYRTAVTSTLALALASRTLAQGIDNDNIAPNCVSQCQSIVTASDTCERQFGDVDNEDQQELDCICNSNGLNTAIPECEACQRQYYQQDDDYDDILTLLSRCGLSTMSVAGSITSMGSSPTGGSTTIITSTYTDPDDSDNDDNDVDLETTTITSVLPTNTAAVTTGGAADSATAPVGSAGNQATDIATSDASQSATEQSGNLAPVVTAAPVLAAVGVAAAAFGL